MAAREVAIEFAGVGCTLAGRAVIRGVSLRFPAGTTTALLGRSGSGKTTLLRAVNGLVMPTAGEVRVGGRTTAEWDPIELRRSIGYVIQETGLFPHRSAGQNAGLALELVGMRGEARVQRVAEVMGLVGLDYGDLHGRLPWQLSGGQRQRVGLARALAGNPAILLMDEPFGALDPMTRAEMQTMLRELLGRMGKTVLLVTHDLDEALYLAGRVIFLDAGEVVADLPAAEVLRSEIPAVRAYVAAVYQGRSAR